VIVLTRIDSRLIHGQVVEAWLPHLKVGRVVVADDACATDALVGAAMKLAVPPSVDVQLKRLDEVDFQALAGDAVPTLVLFRDVGGVLSARQHGLPDGPLNVGNVHMAPGREAVTGSVFLSPTEREALTQLGSAGMAVSIQAVPSEKPTAL